MRMAEWITRIIMMWKHICFLLKLEWDEMHLLSNEEGSTGWWRCGWVHLPRLHCCLHLHSCCIPNGSYTQIFQKSIRILHYLVCECALTECTLTECALTECALTECALTECALTECALTECALTECALTECVLTECALTKCAPTECALTV